MKCRVAILALVWASTIAMSSAENEPRLPTSSVTLAPSIKSSQAVMVCQLVDLGWVDFWGPGESGYDNALFEVRTQLKGASSPRVVCSLRVKTFSLEEREEAPQVGKDYIVAGSPAGGVFMIQKLADATPSNIAEVKRIIGESIPNLVPSPALPPAATPAPAPPVPNATPTLSSPAPTVVESPAPVVEHKSPVWPWVVGIAALTVIALLVWKRRA